MERRTFDLILSSVGIVLTVALVAAGSLGLWAHSYANSNVHNQLAYQQIFFPTKAEIDVVGSVNWNERSIIGKYAGQQVLTADQAKAFAEKIRMDVYSLPYHGVYSKLSAASFRDKSSTTLADDVTTAFKAVTLQALLLQAYAFGTIGEIALWGAVIAFILAGVMLILTVLGFWHMRRAASAEDVPKPHPAL